MMTQNFLQALDFSQWNLYQKEVLWKVYGSKLLYWQLKRLKEKVSEIW